MCQYKFYADLRQQAGQKKSTLVYYSYLTGSEGDSIVVLHPIFLLPVIKPLPADADRHGPQIVIDPEVVLMLWRLRKKDQIKHICD